MPDATNSMILQKKPHFDLALKGNGLESLEDFDEIQNISKSIIYKQNWWKSSCTCSKALKKYVCPHIIALSLKYELCAAPIEAKTVPLGQKRNRRRPSKAKKALERQL